MRRIYVAGASKDVQACAAAIQACRSIGYDCTHDWTQSVLNNMAIGKSDASLSEADRDRYASEDLAGVAACDVFWLRVPGNASLGAWVELGYAIAARKHILVSGDHGRSIFTALAHVHREGDEGAIEYLRERIYR